MKIFLFAIFLLIGCGLHAQRAFFNTGSGVYELTGNIGNCTYKNWGHFCIPDSNVYSLAMHKDTLYLLTALSDLYRVIPDAPGSCQYLTTLPNFMSTGAPASYTCLCCDKNGVLYAVDGFGKGLYRYDPHTDQTDMLGILPVMPAGDLVFYGDTLLYAASLIVNSGGVVPASIYTVNINAPASSKLFMSIAGYNFWGLIAVPHDCSTNRLFGITDGYPARLVEIDPVARTLSGVVCELPFSALDAASTLEDGSIAGLLIDSLAVQAACGANTTGSLQVFTYGVRDGSTRFTLDGGPTNTTGFFPGIPVGAHAVHIQSLSSSGCVADTTFILGKGLSDDIQYQVTEPLDCSHQNGFLQVSASSQSPPVLYSLNGGSPQTVPIFDHLGAGQYTLSITDAGHCQKDTSFVLSYQHFPPFLGPITVIPTVCAGKSGTISIAVAAGFDPSAVSASLNNNILQPSLSFPGLDAGIYTLHIYNTDGCRYDTVVSIIREVNPEPLIRADISDQICFSDNGSIQLSISGANGPYLTKLNSGAYNAALRYDDLAPSAYTISVQDKNVCAWDTVFTVQPYPKEVVTLVIDTVNPVCTELNSGSITIDVRGDRSPYWLRFNNSTYAGGSTIDHLNYGDYSLPVINRDGCVVDSARVSLHLDLKPECNTIYLPSAFSPDGNGVNDVFRVIHAPYLTQIQLRVYNRYGELLFTSSDRRPGWDGTFHGLSQPAGTYVWMVGYTNLNNERKTVSGTVELVR